MRIYFRFVNLLIAKVKYISHAKTMLKASFCKNNGASAVQECKKQEGDGCAREALT